MSATVGRSPKIGANGWGRTEVDGLGEFADVKLWPGGAREWDWAETGTHHRPGIQPEDVTELLGHDVEVVVLSRGREMRLETMDVVRRDLEERGIRVVWAETAEAIEQYNRLVDEGVRVAALIHSTC